MTWVEFEQIRLPAVLKSYRSGSSLNNWKPKVDNNRQFLTTTLLCLAIFFFLFYFKPFGGGNPVGGDSGSVNQIGDRNAFTPTANKRSIINLGSIDPKKSPDANGCLNVAFDSRGASIRRIEITQQDTKGHLITRELDRKSGYMGYLDLDADANNGGALIRSIPNGSPLNSAVITGGNAGTKIQVGDIIKTIDGQPVGDDQMVDEYLEANRKEKKPGDQVELTLYRPADSGFDYQATVTLIPRPKQLLGPTFESSLEDPATYPRTLEMSLVKSSVPGDWPELDRAMRLGNWAHSVGNDAKGEYLEFTFDIPVDANGNAVIDPKRNPAFKVSSDRKLEASEEDDESAKKKESKTDPSKEKKESGKESDEPSKGETKQKKEVAKNPVIQEPKPLPAVVGTIQIVKRFRLPAVEEAQQADRNAKGFHVEMELEIRNETPKKLSLAYRLIGPTTTGVEGWWYQMKPHGDTFGIGKSAGARDLVVKAADSSYDFMGGPEINSEYRSNKTGVEFIHKDSAESYRRLRYVAVDTLYFTSALMFQPETDSSEGMDTYPVIFNAYTSPVAMPPKDATQRIEDLSFRLYKKIEIEPSKSFKQDFQLFAGPKRPDLLHEYGLGDTVTYGWFAWFSIPLCWTLHIFYFFFRNYGIAIILLTVLVRLAMLPISRKAVLNAQMMQLLAPEMKRIKERHPKDMQKQSEEQRDLFRKYKYNPMGGCLVMFLQLPVFMGLYRGLNVDIELRDKALIPGLEWCSNLAAPDQLFDWSNYLWTMIAGEGVGWLGPYFNLLPMVTVALFIIQQKLFTPPPTDEQQEMMQKMMSFMMIFMGIMFFKVPAGLCLYLITSSIWGVMERQLLPKPKLSDHLVEQIKSEGGGSEILDGTVRKAGATKIDDQAKKELKDRDKERKRKLKNRKNP